MLQINALEKAYGPIRALKGVSLDVAEGQIVGLLGPNGAGKTTLVSIVAGLRRPDAGTVTVGGTDALLHPHRVRPRIGFAPQDTGVYPVVTVRGNLRLFTAIAGLKGKAQATHIDEIAGALGIGDLLDRKAGNLSGGQNRRLHTAIALVNQPSLLLLDEATTGTDVATRRHLLELIRSLAHDGAAILYSTHYLHEIEEMDADVVIIEEGEVIASGSVARLVSEAGGGAIELTFNGPAPAMPASLNAVIDGAVIRIPSRDPAAAIPSVLDTLADARSRLRGVELINPSLEAVYLALTGRRFAGNDLEQDDVSVA